MKLKTLTENMNGNGTKTPEQVLTAAFAVVDVRGSYVKAQEQQSTKSDVLAALWGIGVQPGDPSVAFFHGKMKDAAVQNRALDALNWIRSMQITPTMGAADFLRNAQSMAIKPDLNDRQIGFLVGLVPFFEKTKGKVNKAGATIERAWPTGWGDVKMIWKQPVIVEGVRQINNMNGSFQAVDLLMDDKYTFTWFLTDSATTPKRGQKLNVTGYLECHQKMGTIKFVPDRKWAKRVKKELNIGEGGSNTDGDD